MEDSRRYTNKYDDIIELPHHVSKRHIPMSTENRAAQFAAFAALTGYEDAIDETGRLTEDMIELDEDEIQLLDEKMNYILAHIGERPSVSFEYFVPDEKKQGGRYKVCHGIVKKIDEYKKIVVMEDGTIISMPQIRDISIETEKEV